MEEWRPRRVAGLQLDRWLDFPPSHALASQCRLRLLKLERIKDYLLMEQEFIQNQERLKPQQQEKNAVRLVARAPPCSHACVGGAVQSGRVERNSHASRHFGGNY